MEAASPPSLKRKDLPLALLPAGAVAVALVFPDRWQYCLSIVLALFLFLGSYGAGKYICRSFFPFAPEIYFFPLGLGCLLAAVYSVAVVSTAWWVLSIVWAFLILLAVTQSNILKRGIAPSSLIVAPVLMLLFWSALTPVTFFDALVYHLGLPYQYIAQGKMSILPHHLYSSFPPFDQVLNLLFIVLEKEIGIKFFSIILYLYLIAVLLDLVSSFEEGEQNGRQALMAVILLICPAASILIHVTTSDLLVTLFFSSGLAALLREGPSLRKRQLFFASLLVSFSAWTKSNVLLYVALLPFLWIGIWKRQLSFPHWKALGWFYLFFALLLTPLWIRNLQAFRDPLYPTLADKVDARYWTPDQGDALKKDSFKGRKSSSADIFLTPWKITFHPQSFGSASEIGILYLLSLLIFPFAKKIKRIHPVLFYSLICYLAWLFVFGNFRQFFPVFLFLNLICYVSLRRLGSISGKLSAAVLLFCAIFNSRFLLPVYRNYFPVIKPSKTQSEYLHGRVSYFAVAERLNRKAGDISAILLGETRMAYFRKKLVGGTAYNQSPFLILLAQSKDAGDLSDRLKKQGIHFVIFNPKEFSRLASKYRLWKVTEPQQNVLQDFLREHVEPEMQSGDLFLLRIL